MKRRQLALWPAALLAAILLLSGCNARSGGGETAASAGDATLVADLPALVIDYDQAGRPGVGGVPLEEFPSILPAPLIAQLQFPTSTLAALSAANIQHLQVSNTPKGLRLLVNGQPLPTIVWDEDSLANATYLLASSGQTGMQDLFEFLPLVTDLGAGLVLRFAPVPGVTPIPLELTGDASNAVVARNAEQTFLNKAGSRPTIQIPVNYNDDGTWTVHGLTDSDWQALSGLPFGGLRLNPEFVRNARVAGVRNATLRLDRTGIHLAINGEALPYLSWEEGGLLTMLDLAGDFGALEGLPLDEATLDDLAATWLPALQATDVTIEVNFPGE
jgi:predicted small secreted protein